MLKELSLTPNAPKRQNYMGSKTLYKTLAYGQEATIQK